MDVGNATLAKQLQPPWPQSQQRRSDLIFCKGCRWWSCCMGCFIGWRETSVSLSIPLLFGIHSSSMSVTWSCQNQTGREHQWYREDVLFDQKGVHGELRNWLNLKTSRTPSGQAVHGLLCRIISRYECFHYTAFGGFCLGAWDLRHQLKKKIAGSIRFQMKMKIHCLDENSADVQCTHY